MASTSSRRQWLGGTLAAGACGLFGSPLAHGATRTGAAANPIGIATLGFNKLGNAAFAQELSGSGIRLVQLFLAQTDSNFCAKSALRAA
jgi:hypothetical protein